MVLRFLILLAFFVFSCADYERDNIYDIEGKNSPYKECGVGRYDPTTQFCQNFAAVEKCGGKEYATDSQRCNQGTIEDRCGDDWYDASNSNLRCQSKVLEGKCGNAWYAIGENLRCTSNAIEEKCGNNWFVQAEDKRCFLTEVKTKCGSGWYNADNPNFRCISNVLEESCGNDWFNVATDFCSMGGITEYDMFTDARDEKTYKTVAIGSQKWLAENLNYDATDSKCYNNSEVNCGIYGRLYNWDEAVEVCPEGWRLPDEVDWEALLANIGTDYHGFAPLPGGRGFSIYFLDIDYAGSWWSAVPGIEGFAYGQSISFEEESYSFYNSLFNKSYLLSVRCVMDMED